MMDEKRDRKIDVDTQRLEAFRKLPENIVQLLTKEEVKAFLHDDKWPESLREKLKDYLVDVQ